MVVSEHAVSEDVGDVSVLRDLTDENEGEAEATVQKDEEEEKWKCPKCMKLNSATVLRCSSLGCCARRLRSCMANKKEGVAGIGGVVSAVSSVSSARLASAEGLAGDNVEIERPYECQVCKGKGGEFFLYLLRVWDRMVNFCRCTVKLN